MFQEVKGLPDSLNALLYLCFVVGPALLKAVIALTASAGFFLVGVTVRRFGRDRRQQKRQAAKGPRSGTRDARGFDGRDDDGRDDDDDDRDAESGGLIVSGKRGPLLSAEGKPYSAVPLRCIVVPRAASAAAELGRSQDFGRGR